MTPHPAAADQTAVEVDSLDFCYGSKQSLFNVTMKVPRNRVTAFIGRAREVHAAALYQPDE